MGEKDVSWQSALDAYCIEVEIESIDMYLNERNYLPFAQCQALRSFLNAHPREWVTLKFAKTYLENAQGSVEEALEQYR